MIPRLLAIAILGSGWIAVPSVAFQDPPVQTVGGESAVGRAVKFVALEMARDRSRVSGDPILLYFHAAWCVGCDRQLQVMAGAEFAAAASNWNIVSVDLDRDVELAATYNVLQVPTLIALDASGREVARQTGMLEAEALVRWLKSGGKLAARDATDILIGVEAPTRTEIKELIELMGSASPEVREVALTRMASFPEKTRAAAIDALPKTSLASRLSLLDLLGRWQAPIEGIDAWEPASLSEPRMELLRQWSETPVEELTRSLETVTPEQLQVACLELDRFLKDTGEPSRLLPPFSRYGKHLLPEVYRRLGASESDVDRQKLMALRYWLTAGSRLRLIWSTGFTQMGAVSLDVRREAVRQLLARVTTADADLLLELFGDSDPLIREMSLRGLQKVGGRQTDEALLRLLSDPDLNVRAAVLKQLAEQKPTRMIPHVAKYLDTEQDTDLIVHALRFFKEAANAEQQLPVLLKLVDNANWQVRAMVAEVLGEMGSSYETEAVLKVSISDALVKLLEDPDEFVVARAAEGLPAPQTKTMLDRLAAIVDKRPQLASKIVAAMCKSDYSSSSREMPSPIDHLLAFSRDERPAVRVAAIEGLATKAIHKIAFETMLADSAESVRIAAAHALMTRLSQFASEASSQDNLVSNSFSDVGMVESMPDEPPRSLLGSWWEGIFGGGGPPAPDVRSAPAQAPVEGGNEPGQTTAADEPESGTNPERTLPREAHEEWIAQWIAKPEGRPEWIGQSAPRLEPMAAAANPKERFPALLALAALDPTPERVSRAYEAALASADTLVQLGQLFRWLPAADRLELLERILQNRQYETMFNQLIQDFASVRSLAAADFLWQLTEDPKINSQALFGAILQATFGEGAHAYETLSKESSVAPPLVHHVREQALARLDAVEQNTWRWRLSLVQLYWLDPQAGAERAKGLLERPDGQDVTTLDVALQIRLALLTPDTLSGEAIKLLPALPNSLKKTVLRYSVTGFQPYFGGTSGTFAVPTYAEAFGIYDRSSGDAKLRVPKPPKGLERATIAPLLESSDAETKALVTYFLILLGGNESLTPLADYWNSKQDDEHVAMLLVDAIVVRNDDSLTPLLTQIYELHGQEQYSDFPRKLYWTIRSMSGPGALRLRQRIRDEVGMSQLQ